MPTAEDFVLCEDARLEVGGLLTLVGYIPGAISLPGPGNLRITCVLVLQEMTGIERFLLQLEVSVGKDVLYKSGVIECKRHAAEAHTIVHVIQPFPTPRPGKYVVRATLETSTATTNFDKVLRVEMPAPT